MKRIIWTLALIVCVVFNAAAQTNSGVLTGEIKDSTGAVISGASIQITNLETNAVVTVETNEEGRYNVASLAPGNYQVTVEKTGFRKSLLASVAVLTAQTITANVALEIGTADETVEVRDESPLLTADSPILATTIENRLLDEIPFTDRSALGAVTLAAGVTGDPQYPNGVQSENVGIFTQPITPGGSLQVSGSRPGTSALLIDGADNSLASNPRTGVSFSGETAREVTVQQNGLSAQYGRTGGGILNQSTKGGTKNFFASASWQHNEPKFQAKTFGSPADPAKRQNQESFIVSGPVFFPRFGEGTPYLYNGKKRTFFFFSYEPTQLSDMVFSRGRVPTPDELAGRFNNSLEVLNQTVLSTQGIEAALAAPRTGGIAYRFNRNAQGFYIGRQLAATAAVAIPNNDLSAQLALNPTAQFYLSFFPRTSNQYIQFYRADGLYDRDGTNAFLARGVDSRDERLNFRIDHLLTKNDQLAARFTYVPVNGTRYNFLGPDNPAQPIFSDKTNSSNFVLSETHVFGGSTINDFRVTYTRVNQQRIPVDVSIDKDYSVLGGLVPATLGVGFPNIANLVQTIGNQQNNGPGKTLDRNLGFSDDFSFVRGNHNIKIGGNVRFLGFDRLDTSGLYGGAYGFTPGLTANPTRGNTGVGIATFILGAVSSFSYRPEAATFKYRWNYYAAYAQDDWKVGRNLTLNFGLRYNLETPRREADDRQGYFDPNVTGTLNGLPVQGGFVFSGQDGRNRSIFPTNYLGFEPRVGIAYQPFEKMTLRASYSLIHTPLTGLGLLVTPDLSSPSASSTGGNGGVQPGSVAYANYITNPIAPVTTRIPTTGPLFSFPSGVNLPYVDQSKDVPYVQLWSASLQYQISRSAVIEAAYSGQKGTHLFSPPLNLNIPTNERIVAAIRANANFNNASLTNIYYPAINTETLYQSLRPYQQFYDNAIDSIYDRRASSTYHALYLTFKQRLTQGVTVTASYSFSKSIDDFSSGFPDTGTAAQVDSFAPARTQNPFDLKSERSVSTFDIPQKLSVGVTAQIPFGRGKALDFKNGILNNIFGGFTLSGIFTRQSGYPLQVYLGSFNNTNQSNVTGYFCSTPAPTTAVPNPVLCSSGNAVQDVFLRPNVVPGVPLINPNWDSSNPLAQPYINPAAFAIPGSPGNPQFGNTPRTLSSLRTPTAQSFDSSLRKRVKLFGEKSKHYIELRADVFNVLNRRNLILGIGNSRRSLFSGVSGGQFTSAAGFGFLEQADATRGRTLRLGIKVAF